MSHTQEHLETGLAQTAVYIYVVTSQYPRNVNCMCVYVCVCVCVCVQSRDQQLVHVHSGVLCRFINLHRECSPPPSNSCKLASPSFDVYHIKAYSRP